MTSADCLVRNAAESSAPAAAAPQAERETRSTKTPASNSIK